MKASFTFFGVFALLFLFGSGCAEKASSEDVEQMCRHLTELRSEDKADGAAMSEAMEKCKADPMITGVSAKVAKCRIAAQDVDAFWNKCR